VQYVLPLLSLGFQYMAYPALCRHNRHPLHNMPWSDEKLKQVIAQYTPVLHLHHKERYLPCTVEWYLQRSQLWHVDGLDEKVSACF